MADNRASAVALSIMIIFFLRLTISQAGWDLNELPDLNDIEMEPVQANPPDARTKAAQNGKKLVPPGFHNKLLKLFQKLKICDDINFDINSIQIPESFSDETKVMRALIQVNKKNFIPKIEKARFARIMNNCSQIARIVQDREEKVMSQESQMSGGTWEDTVALFRNSPLQNIRDRLAKINYVNNQQQKVQTNSIQNKQQQSFSSLGNIRILGQPTEGGQSNQQFFTFL